VELDLPQRGVVGELASLLDRNELYFAQPEFQLQERHKQGLMLEHLDAFKVEDVAQYGFNLVKTAYGTQEQNIRVRGGVSNRSGKAVGGVQLIVNW
jgi:hypothetical protein